MAWSLSNVIRFFLLVWWTKGSSEIRIPSLVVSVPCHEEGQHWTKLPRSLHKIPGNTANEGIVSNGTPGNLPKHKGI